LKYLPAGVSAPRAYSVFATGQALMAPAISAASGFYDECMKGEIRFSLGFCKPGPTSPFCDPGSFGHPGAGGSFAFVDPEAGTGYDVTNRMGTHGLRA
jgi:hypothetical protein